ncbi:depupylase/deamidase Dop [Janibacter alkaliphilus]|uniref:Proteasome accessory factor A n=1 Tax=Janibacter alkaliphilus TaxID=1069963 RepID=A0A852X436_9MICO|nr:depupylase/deamidase Dop [Janibacter alkaliphilus]NYG38132.1 proteasome accessory factor A [Janibacter alkaliphilus]
MGVRRVMGTETEYGIAVPDEPSANPMEASGRVVTTYALAHGHRATHGAWDYSDEHPLLDARGFELPRSRADISQLTDEEDPTLANVVLGNGARLYVDHAHPEYSTPEVTSPRNAVVHDRAGVLVMREVVARLAERPPGINLYKNNTDGKGASYGSHENYLMDRETPFARIVRQLTPFFVARQVLCGAGRVGIGPDSEHDGYQIASRSDFFEAEVGLETTFKRPIINTRDEPHADPERHRRLHVILGDATQADVAGLLKVGTTSLVLGLIEAGAIDRDLEVLHPVTALKQISHDPTCQVAVRLRDGRELTAVQILTEYLEMARRFVDREGSDAATEEVLGHWERVLGLLASDPMDAAADVDWVAKLALLQRYRDRDGLGWGDPRLRAIDIQWSDVRADKGLFHRLEAAGRITRLTDDAEVAAAVTTPPEDTRAWLRGRTVTTHPEQVISASWDSLVLRRPGAGGVARIGMLDPLRHGRADTEALIGGDVESLVAGLARLPATRGPGTGPADPHSA